MAGHGTMYMYKNVFFKRLSMHDIRLMRHSDVQVISLTPCYVSYLCYVVTHALHTQYIIRTDAPSCGHCVSCHAGAYR